MPYKSKCYKYVFICIPNLVQDGSGINDDFVKNAEDSNKPTKDASEANTSDIVPEQPKIMTAESNDEIHNIQSMDVGPDDNIALYQNESMKIASIQVQHIPFGRCIGRKFQVRSIHN